MVFTAADFDNQFSQCVSYVKSRSLQDDFGTYKQTVTLLTSDR
jgi:hypothetical protein